MNGYEGKLYIDTTAGTKATTEIKKVKNVSLSLNGNEADTTTRGDGGWKMTDIVLFESSVDLEFNYKANEQIIVDLIDSFLNKSPISCFIADDAGNGLDADWIITSCPIDQPVSDKATIKITIKPTNKTAACRKPAWQKAGA